MKKRRRTKQETAWRGLVHLLHERYGFHYTVGSRARVDFGGADQPTGYKRALAQQALTMYHTAFCEVPLPHTVPVRATDRKIIPSLALAPPVHWSRAASTHSGMGTVRILSLLAV